MSLLKDLINTFKLISLQMQWSIIFPNCQKNIKNNFKKLIINRGVIKSRIPSLVNGVVWNRQLES
jgi:hypothetical protein